MPVRAHLVDHAARDQVLVKNAAGNGRLPGRELFAADQEARLFHRGLRPEAAIEDTGQDLVDRRGDPGVTRGAHRQNGHRLLALSLEDQRGRYSGGGASERGQRIEALRLTAERAKVIVVEEAKTVAHVEGPAPGRQGLRERHHVAFRVHDHRGRGSRPDPLPLVVAFVFGLFGILGVRGSVPRHDGGELLSRPGQRQRLVEIQSEECGIRGQIAPARPLPRFHHEVEGRGVLRVLTAPVARRAVEDLKGLEEGHPRGHRWGRRHHLIVLVATPQGLAFDRPVLREVLFGDEAAILPHVLGDPPRDVTAIEVRSAHRRDPSQGRRVVGVSERVARLQGLPGGQEDLRGRVVPFKEPLALPHRRGQRLVQSEAFLGRADRGLNEILPRELAAAVFPICEIHPRHHSGNVSGGRSRRNQPVAVEDLRIGERAFHRDLILEVDGHGLPVGRAVDQHHPFAADARGVLLGHAERERNRDNRIDHVASTAQGFEARGGGERMRRHHHGAR